MRSGTSLPWNRGKEDQAQIRLNSLGVASQRHFSGGGTRATFGSDSDDGTGTASGSGIGSATQLSMLSCKSVLV